ncbi:MAG: hypothetical protein JWO13_33 [Acidobacteriales bacterium]|nr:hypothetical protein [Terriglobales bacterium]
MLRTPCFLVILFLATTLSAQDCVLEDFFPHRPSPFSSADDASPQSIVLTKPVEVKRSFQWADAMRQSFFFLSMQHGARMMQRKTRHGFSGPFLGDYVRSVENIHGWGDGDSIFTNYVGHPMQGAITGYIEVQNDPTGKQAVIGKTFRYWNSRLRAMAWAAAYSTQFEIGPMSEATIGHVGMKRGTAGYVDLVMTPTAGMGLIVAEDAVDRWLIRRLEHAEHPGKTRFYRMTLNPTRSFANLLRFKHPWYRDTRGMGTEEAEKKSPPVNSNVSTSAKSRASSTSDRDK